MKIVKGIFIVITMIMIIGIFEPKSAAVEVKTFDQMKTSISSWLNKGKSGKSGINSSEMGKIIIPIANILTAIGAIVWVAVTMILGIKYMFASPEEAAKLKQQLIGLVVAGIVIFAATAIWKIVYQILSASGL